MSHKTVKQKLEKLSEILTKFKNYTIYVIKIASAHCRKKKKRGNFGEPKNDFKIISW